MSEIQGPGRPPASDYEWHRPEPYPPYFAPKPPSPHAPASVPTMEAPLPAGLDGWQPDPFGMHEERFFRHGEPTPLVRDNGVGSYDESPRSLAPTAHPTQRDSHAVSSVNGTAPAVPTPTPRERGWYQLPDEPEMARYWNGRQWEGAPQLVEEIQHGVTPGEAQGPGVPAHPKESAVRRAHPGAKIVSTVFKVGAWLVILGGAFGTVAMDKVLHDHGMTGSRVAEILAGIVAGSLVIGAALGFFAYVLALLIEISSKTE